MYIHTQSNTHLVACDDVVEQAEQLLVAAGLQVKVTSVGGGGHCLTRGARRLAYQ